MFFNRMELYIGCRMSSHVHTWVYLETITYMRVATSIDTSFRRESHIHMQVSMVTSVHKFI
jgi:hypothetical protein